MICYLNRPWCGAACANESCDRKLTQKVQDDAFKWWNSNTGAKDPPPIAVGDFSSSCDEFEPDTEAPDER